MKIEFEKDRVKGCMTKVWKSMKKVWKSMKKYEKYEKDNKR